MEEERVYNEMSHQLPAGHGAGPHGSHRTRTVSSPVPLAAACPAGLTQPQAGCSSGRPLSPGLNYGERRDLPLPVIFEKILNFRILNYNSYSMELFLPCKC